MHDQNHSPISARSAADVAQNLNAMRTEQRRHLDGVPPAFFPFLLIYGSDDHSVAQGAFNMLSLFGYWAEMHITPGLHRFEVWHLEVVSVPTKHGEAMLHPTMSNTFGRPDRPPDLVVEESGGDDAYYGTRAARRIADWYAAQAPRGDT